MRVNTPWITQQTSLTYKSYKYVNNAQTSRTTNVRGFSHTPYLFGHGKRIPPAELETIVRLRRQGEEYLKIVSVLGNNRTVASVASAYHRFCKATGSDQQLGKHTFLTVSQHEDIAKLRHAGKQWREIAPVFGMSHVGLNAAHCRYMKNPARPPRRWWDDDDTKHLFHLRDDLQLPWGEVARIFNRTKSAVTRRYYLVQAEGKPDRIRLLNKYSQEELELLIDLREVQKLSWREISERLGRPLQGTRTRYSKLKMEQGNAPRSLKYHTPEEDRKLMRLRENGALSWKEVQAAMPHRSLPTLQTRFYLLRKKNGTSSAGDSAIQQSIGPKGARSFSTTTSEDFSTVSNRSISRRPLWTGLLHGPRLLSQSMFRRHRRLAHTAAVSAVEKETSEFTWRNLPRKRYTKEEDELILRRKLEGKFDVDIGMELGRSHSSIRHRFRHLHGRRRHIPQEGSTRRASPRPFSPAETAYLMTERQAGTSYIAIGKTLQRPLSSLQTRFEAEMKKKGIPKASYKIERSRRFTDDDIQTIRELREEGQTWVKIAAVFGTNPKAVRKRYNLRCDEFASLPGTLGMRKVWSPEEVRELVVCRDEMRMDWRDISKRLGSGRTVEALRRRYYSSPREGLLEEV